MEKTEMQDARRKDAVTCHWYSLSLSVSFPVLETFSDREMWSMSLMTSGDTRTVEKSAWKQVGGWATHLKDSEFVLQAEVTETRYLGKAFHC